MLDMHFGAAVSVEDDHSASLFGLLASLHRCAATWGPDYAVAGRCADLLWSVGWQSPASVRCPTYTPTCLALVEPWLLLLFGGCRVVLCFFALAAWQLPRLMGHGGIGGFSW